MTTREFKSLAGVKDGKPVLGDLSKKQCERVKSYARALEKAGNSAVAKPKFSDYHVRAAIGPVKSRFYPAGNIEYGDRKALHAEECAVAAYFSRTNGQMDAFQLPILALVAGSPGSPATPCGNCRDILLDAFGPDLEIVSGSPDGGVAIVCKLQDYLFDNPTRMIALDDEPEIRMSFDFLNAQKRKVVTSDPYGPPAIEINRQYAALILAHNGEDDPKIFFGGRQLFCDYHPLYPIRDALRQLEHWQTPMIQFVTVIADQKKSDQPPHVPYCDRQHLMEIHLRGEVLDGRHEWDPRVYLVNANHACPAVAWKTSVKQWLPHPFSPANFGPEFMDHFIAYHQNKNRGE